MRGTQGPAPLVWGGRKQKPPGPKGTQRKTPGPKGTQPAKRATFKRTFKASKRRKLAAKPAAAAAEPPAEPAEPAAGAKKVRRAPLSPMHPSAWLGKVPEEAYPAASPKGRANYTVYAPNGAVIEVQLQSRAFYLKKAAAGVQDASRRSVAWNKHGGAWEAWTLSKRMVGWA